MPIAQPLLPVFFRSLLLLCLVGINLPQATAQSSRDWVIDNEVKDFPGRAVHTKTLTLHPAAEPRPALKYRFIPSEFNRVDGNAATYYLRAIGFVEQRGALKQIFKLEEKAHQEAREKGIASSDIPPFSWQGMAPDQLPLEEVKKYLMLTDFQARDIAVASTLRSLDFNRNIRNVESPMSTLLPEVQQFRALANTQSIRCRVAIAEGRFDDAIEIMGHQYAMANHLNQDRFLVCSLVSAGIAGINWEDALDLVQRADAPNLYWALASLPKPLIPLRETLSAESELLFMELKALKEVNEQPQPAGYWMIFADRILSQYNNVLSAFQNLRALNRFDLANFIAAGYPGAKQYLIETEGMDTALVESYPIAQVFFLAQKKYSEHILDAEFKLGYLDLPTILSNHSTESPNHQSRRQAAAQAGWITVPVESFVPAITQVLAASSRIELQIVILQAVEGIRMYAAEHNHQLPQQLSDLSYPVPNNPFTGKPLGYEVNEGVATLTAEMNTYIYQLNLQIAQ